MSRFPHLNGAQGRIPFGAAAGLLVGLGLGMAACLIVALPGGRPNSAPVLSGDIPQFRPQADSQAGLTRSGSMQLVGLKGSAVRDAFGEPEMRRREPPAEVWQYRSPSCVLDLYFYGDPDGEGVVHFEFRLRDARQAPSAALPDGCVREVASRRRPLI